MDQARRSAGKYALLTVPVIVVVGLLMGVLSNSGFGNPWFDGLVKPALMPPGWVFGAAWTTLYIILGVSLALILGAPESRARSAGIWLILLQLLLNFSWSLLFFGAHQVIIGLAVIATIVILTFAAGTLFWRMNRTAALLLVPYLAWLCFATYLNFEIMRLNPGA